MEARGHLFIHHMGSRAPTQVVWLGDNLAGLQIPCLILNIFCGCFQDLSQLVTVPTAFMNTAVPRTRKLRGNLELWDFLLR